MFRKQRVRLAAGVVAGAMLIGACGSDLTAPRDPHRASLPPAVVAARVDATTGAAVAIDDVLTRLVGSLDAATSAALRGPLTAVDAALKSRDAAALTGSIAVARQALVEPAALNDDRAPDLAAISLALDAAASGQ